MWMSYRLRQGLRRNATNSAVSIIGQASCVAVLRRFVVHTVLCLALLLFPSPPGSSAASQSETAELTAAPPAPQSGAFVPAAVTDQSHSIDAALVFELPGVDGEVHYGLYGHTPRVPKPVDQSLTWNWWTIGASGATTTTVATKALDTGTGKDPRPDIAFSREGSALAVWGGTTSPSPTYTCSPPGNPPQELQRFHGAIRFARLIRQADGNASWTSPSVLADTPNTASEDHIYSNPSVAIDSNGVAVAIWVHTRISYSPDCSMAFGMQIMTRRWDGANWVGEKVVAPDPAIPTAFEPTKCAPTPSVASEFCETFTDLTFLSARAPNGSATRQQAIAVWMDFIDSVTVVCGSTPNPISIFWPKFAVWTGDGFGAAAEIPDRPAVPPPYMRFPLRKLGVSGTGDGGARLLFPVYPDPDPCSFGDEWREVRASNWNGASWSAVTTLDNGTSPDVAVLPDGSAVGVSVFGGLNWATANVTGTWTVAGSIGGVPRNPTLASLAHGRLVSVWSEVGALKYSFRDGAGAWNGALDLTSAVNPEYPELAAHTGSPGLPHAEWSIFEYDDGDPYTAGAGEQHDHILTRYESVGSTALINAVALYDDPGAPTHTKLFYLKRGARTELRDLGSMNVGDPATLLDFIAWSFENYPARQRILKLSDHGMGWQGTCIDSRPTANDRLDLPELRQALSGAIGSPPLPAGRPFKAIVFHPCQMAMVEVAYQLRDFAEYMTASQENTAVHSAASLPNASFREDLMLQHLVDKPQIAISNSVTGTNRGLVQLLVDDYGTSNQINRRDYTYSAIALGATVQSLAADVQAFGTAMTQYISDSAVPTSTLASRKAVLRGHISNAQQIRGDGTYRDLFNFASLVQGDGTLPASVTNAAQAVLNRKAAMVVAEWHDPGPVEAGGLSKANATGLNIWLPDTGGRYSGGQGSPTSTAYNALEFVQQFLGGLPAPASTWSAFLAQVHGSTDIVVRLASSSPNLFPTVQNGAGQYVGGLSNENCGIYCASNVAGSICQDFGTSKTLWLPYGLGASSAGMVRPAAQPFSNFIWTVDATYVATSAATYTLSIQVIVDGAVVKDQTTPGTLAAGSSLTGTFSYEPPATLFVPGAPSQRSY